MPINHQPATPAHDEDMTVRNFAGNAQRLHPARQDVHRLPWPLTRTQTAEDLRRFQVHQTSNGVVHRASTARWRRCGFSMV